MEESSAARPSLTNRLACRCCYTLPCCNGCRRYLVALLTSMGFLAAFAFRINMGVFLFKTVKMRDSFITQEESQDASSPQWSVTEISLVDSCHFWGCAISQLPGGILAARYPANRIFGFALLISSVLHLGIPASAKLHFSAVMVLYFLQGIMEGVLFPACLGIWRFWAPPLERSRLVTISFCGAYVGSAIGLIGSYLLAEHVWWQLPFYIFGGFGVLWWIVWHFLSSEKPSTYPFISEQERTYIENSLRGPTAQRHQNSTPWKSIFTSMPVYAIIIANFSHSVVSSLVISQTPVYLIHILSFNVTGIGFINAMPNFINALFVPLGGLIADCLLMRGLLNTTVIRKVFTCTGFGIEAIFLIAAVFSHSVWLLFMFLAIAIFSNSFAFSGFKVNPLDIAPRYAPVVMGLAGIAGSLGHLILPICVSLLTIRKTTTEWEVVFVATAIIHFASVAFYAIFASGEKQLWADSLEPNNPDTIDLNSSPPVNSNEIEPKTSSI